MSLFVQTSGIGADLVLIHGWGFHGGIWDEPFCAILMEWGYRLHRVDLPGHGNSPEMSLSQIDDWAQAVREVVPPGAIWCGWSLGGMVALAGAALFPQHIRALIMVCTAPRFVSGEDWRAGLNPAVMAIFGAGLQENWRGSVTRFLALQDRGGENNNIIRQLRSTLFARPPTVIGLETGLKILQKTDLRPRLAEIICPTLVVLGERDYLFPASLAKDLAQLRPDWRISIFAQAGHVPFLTHRTVFLNELADFFATL